MAKVKSKLDENFVAEQVGQIIEKLGISATAEVGKVDDAQDPQPRSAGRGSLASRSGLRNGHGPIFLVDITSEDSSLLIGKHGANLEALQFILAVRLKTLTGEEDFELLVDVGGWRRQREEKLRSLAASLAQEVERTGQPQTLFDLAPWQRRVVHVALANHPKVESLSEGEGQDRHLVIKPR